MNHTWDSYINYVVGKPWANRTSGPMSFDCYGLLIDSFRKINGITLPFVDGYSSKKPIEQIGTNEAFKKHWLECNEKEAQVFACYDADGNMFHVGRITPFGALHAFGQYGQGQVSMHSVKALTRIMRSTVPKFDNIKYYRFVLE